MSTNARFWIFWNGSPVKLTLSVGESLSCHRFDRHDEGWLFESRTFSYDGTLVTRDETSDGVDCDGRLSTHDSAWCPLGSLKNRTVPDVDVPLPSWQHLRSRKRDYQAEAAGY